MLHTTRRIALLWTLALALAGCASQPALQRAAPEEAGFSTARLKEFSAAVQAKVDKGEIPGAVVLVARDGKVVWLDSVGYLDREAKTPMRPDALFRMASMTKPITSLAIMMLAEEGKLKITDPVSKYLPEFTGMQVGVEKKDATGKPELVLEPARAEITITDLLRHTSGITYGIFGKSLVKERYPLSLFDPKQTGAEFAAKMAKLPLQYQPGTRWEYGMSTDVLSRVVEVASGMPTDQFVRTRILQPLRMSDTDYWVDPARQPRMAQPQLLAATGKRPGGFDDMKEMPRWIPGGHGLASTAADYARFCQMLLNGGTLDGVRIVSQETVDLMRKDHLPTQLPAGLVPEWNIMAPTVDNGIGFGLGFKVRTSEGTRKIPGSIGDYGWGGANGTYFWVDPKQRMFVVFMLAAPADVNQPMRRFVREQVYRAIN